MQTYLGDIYRVRGRIGIEWRHDWYLRENHNEKWCIIFEQANEKQMWKTEKQANPSSSWDCKQTMGGRSVSLQNPDPRTIKVGVEWEVRWWREERQTPHCWGLDGSTWWIPTQASEDCRPLDIYRWFGTNHRQCCAYRIGRVHVCWSILGRREVYLCG